MIDLISKDLSAVNRMIYSILTGDPKVSLDKKITKVVLIIFDGLGLQAFRKRRERFYEVFHKEPVRLINDIPNTYTALESLIKPDEITIFKRLELRGMTSCFIDRGGAFDCYNKDPTFSVKAFSDMDTYQKVLQNLKYDFILAHFYDLDLAQHGKIHKRPEEATDEILNFIEDIYRNLPKETLLVVVSDHGIHGDIPKYKKDLSKKDFMKRKRKIKKKAKESKTCLLFYIVK